MGLAEGYKTAAEGRLPSQNGLKADRNEAVKMVAEILKDDCDDPAEKIIAQGKALVKIGEALRGQSTASAKAIVMAAKAVCELSDATA